MRLLFRLTGLVLTLLLALLLGTVLLLLENQPLVPGAGLAPADLRQARVFLENSDPRQLSAGELASFTLGESDLELLLNYLLQNLRGGRSRVAFTQGNARLRLSARLPDNILGDYLNVDLRLREGAGALVLDELQIGQLDLPGWLADPLMQRAHEELKRRVPEYLAAVQAVNAYSLDPERLNVSYRWQPALLEQLSSRGRDLLVSEADRERLVAYTTELATLLAREDLPRRVPVMGLLGPLFAHGGRRAGDPVEENRAALLVLALYDLDIELASVVGEQAALPELPRRLLYLGGRRDLAQHFLVSAGLAVSAGSGVADAFALFKEMDDTRAGGSGFSFTDLGADQTGVRFARLAVADPARALALQNRLAAGLPDTEFLPDFTDLPEFLSGEEFSATYGGVGQPAYDAVLADIERRIGQMPLFAELE